MAQRICLALLPISIAPCAAGTVALVMRPSVLPNVVALAAFQHTAIVLTMLVRYRREKASFALKWSGGLGFGSGALMVVVMLTYWSGGHSPHDELWPLTNIMGFSFLFFVFSLLLCAVWCALTSERQQQGSE